MLARMLRPIVDSLVSKRTSSRHIAVGVFVSLAILALYLKALPYYAHNKASWTRPGSAAAASNTSSEEWRHRTERVKQAFRHAYGGYELYAMPHDELRPLTKQIKDNFNGWGVTVFDSLDTMILMGLTEEFARALPIVEQADFIPSPNVTNKHVGYAPFFETVIRYLGGLLSAYALSKEPILLQRADDLGRLLSPAFDTASGFPTFGVNIERQEGVGSPIGVLAEIASCQLEYTYLARATGKKAHWEKADGVMTNLALANLSAIGDMMPRRWSLESAKPTDDFLSVGAAADSAHEYLLKEYLLTARSDPTSYQMYLRTTNHILTHLLYLSETRDLLYVTDTSRTSFLPSHRFEHLSCFLPGLLALGADQLDLSLDDLDLTSLGTESLRSYEILKHYDLRALHKWAAEGLATSCWLMYADQASGLGPDEVTMRPRSPNTRPYPGERGKAPYRGKLWIDFMEKWRYSGSQGSPPGLGDKPPVFYTEEEARNPKLRAIKDQERDYSLLRTDYLLRPETLESIFIMWKTTGDPIWRERGWSIFEAIERASKTPSGYASVNNVLLSPPPLTDDMPSYFLAETLKYLYLMFHEEDLLPLDKWVFNTEAHPFPVFAWSSWEKSKFGIAEPSS